MQINIDSFELEGVVGKGGFGIVKAAIKRTSMEWFAIKIVSKDQILKKRDGVSSMFNELRILSQLPESQLWMYLHWAFTDQRHCYLVSDLISGGDMRYHLANLGRTFTEKEAKFYLASLLLAVGKLHSYGILHRDIKPENVVLNAQGFMVLTDFGISHALASGTIGFLFEKLQ